MSAHCNRVAVEDGHTESVSVKLKSKAQADELISAWNDFRSLPQELKLPTAPEKPVVYVRATDRPQPRFDADLGAGMETIGRNRPNLAKEMQPRIGVENRLPELIDDALRAPDVPRDLLLILKRTSTVSVEHMIRSR